MSVLRERENIKEDFVPIVQMIPLIEDGLEDLKSCGIIGIIIVITRVP